MDHPGASDALYFPQAVKVRMHCFNVKKEDASLEIGANEFQLFMELAIDHQWTPAGTIPDPELPRYTNENTPKWEGSYVLQQGEIVTEDDAGAWAACLEHALQVHAVGMGETHTAIYLKAKEFISFLRMGAFQIF